MSLIRRNAYDMFDEMERMMDRMRSMMSTSLGPLGGRVLQPDDANMLAVDVSSDGDGITVRAPLPGFKEDEVDVGIQGNVLTITAESSAEREDSGQNWHVREMRYGKFARSVTLPEEVSVDKADASLEDGILTVKLPKEKPSPLHKIAVTAKNLLGRGKKEE